MCGVYFGLRGSVSSRLMGFMVVEGESALQHDESSASDESIASALVACGAPVISTGGAMERFAGFGSQDPLQQPATSLQPTTGEKTTADEF